MKLTLFITTASICFVQMAAVAQSFPFGLNVLPNQTSGAINDIFAINAQGSEVGFRANNPPGSARSIEGYVSRYGGVTRALNVTQGPQDIHFDATPDLARFVLASNNSGRFEAMFHELGQAPISLGVTAGYAGSAATRLSRAGDIVFGYDFRLDGASDVFLEPFRWTAATGRQALGHARPGAMFTQITDISDDGSVGVGYSGVAGMGTPFRWTASSGYTFLAAPIGGSTVAAYGVTPDGNTVVGTAGADQSLYAAIWRDVSQPPQLLREWYSSAALFVADGGDMIIGEGRSDPPGTLPGSRFRPFIWTQATGMVTATDYFRDLGIAIPAGGTINQITYVSDDGTMFGCTVVSDSGAFEGFGALIVIPAPAGMLTLIPFLAVSRRRRV